MIWLDILRRAWPLVIGGLLLAGAWMLVQSHKKEAELNGALTQQVEHLEEALVEEAAVADVVAEQSETARVALKRRESQLHQLRSQHEQLRRELRAVVADAGAGDCLLAPVHPGAARLLLGTRSDRGAPDPPEP